MLSRSSYSTFIDRETLTLINAKLAFNYNDKGPLTLVYIVF